MSDLATLIASLRLLARTGPEEVWTVMPKPSAWAETERWVPQT